MSRRTTSRFARRDAAYLLVAAVAVAVSVFLRPGLEEQRKVLAPPSGRVPGEDLASGGSALAGVLSPASGFFRPLALNVLWLRLDSLHRSGRFFEAASLASVIAELQPRIPDVWSFQAWNLAFNISRESSVADRAGWVFEGIRLLRDRGLDHNPGAAQIYRNLSWFFFFKIDGDRDHAHLSYKLRLAREFEIESSTSPDAAESTRVEKLREWRLDAGYLARISRDWLGGVEPDLRVGSTHGLYWAVAGLEQPRTHAPTWESYLLDRYRLASLQGLVDHGRVIRSADRGGFVFAPDLRFARKVAELIDADEEKNREDPEALEEIRLERRIFRQQMAYYARLWNRLEEADRWWRLAQWSTDDGSLDEYVVEQILRREDRERATREDALARLAGMVRGVLGLSLAGEQGLAGGVHRAALLFRETWNRERSEARLPSVDQVIGAVARSWESELRARDETRPLAERLRAVAPSAFGESDPRTEAELGLPPPGSLRDGEVLLMPGLETIGPGEVAEEERR